MDCNKGRETAESHRKQNPRRRQPTGVLISGSRPLSHNTTQVQLSESDTEVNVESSIRRQDSLGFIVMMYKTPQNQGLGDPVPPISMPQQLAIWVDDERLNGDRIAVLVALTRFADIGGRCWPSQGTIADRLGWSRSRICRIISDLQELGYIRTEFRRRANGGNTSKIYRLIGARWAVDQASEPLCKRAHPPVSERDSIITHPTKELLSNAHGANICDGEREREGVPQIKAEEITSTWSPSTEARRLGEQLRPELEFDEVLKRFRIVHAGRKTQNAEDIWRKWFARERFCRKRPIDRSPIRQIRGGEAVYLTPGRERAGSHHTDPEIREIAARSYIDRYGMALKVGRELSWPAEEIRALANDPVKLREMTKPRGHARSG